MGKTTEGAATNAEASVEITDIVSAVLSYRSGPVINYIAGFSRTVLDISFKETELRKQVAKTSLLRASLKQLPPGSIYYLLSSFAEPSAMH